MKNWLKRRIVEEEEEQIVFVNAVILLWINRS